MDNPLDSVWSPVPRSPKAALLAARDNDSTYIVKVEYPDSLSRHRLDSIRLSMNYSFSSFYIDTVQTPGGPMPECRTYSAWDQMYVPAVTIKLAPGVK
jgi:hypothetical protein